MLLLCIVFCYHSICIVLVSVVLSTLSRVVNLVNKSPLHATASYYGGQPLRPYSSNPLTGSLLMPKSNCRRRWGRATVQPPSSASTQRSFQFALQSKWSAVAHLVNAQLHCSPTWKRGDSKGQVTVSPSSQLLIYSQAELSTHDIDGSPIFIGGNLHLAPLWKSNHVTFSDFTQSLNELNPIYL